jgi:hypothetical protein
MRASSVRDQSLRSPGPALAPITPSNGARGYARDHGYGPCARRRRACRSRFTADPRSKSTCRPSSPCSQTAGEDCPMRGPYRIEAGLLWVGPRCAQQTVQQEASCQQRPESWHASD